MLDFLRRIYKYKKKTMKQSTTQCQDCVNHGFIMVSGGLEKKEFCEKYHKEPGNDCPDWEKWDYMCEHNYTKEASK
jgi:hypothetical protein